MKECPGGYHIVTKSASIVPGDIPLTIIIYKYIPQKALWFIIIEGVGSTEPGVTYLSCHPENNNNVSICPVFLPHVIDGYFSA